MSVPSVFGLPHLSEDAVAAFADGVLSAAATDRARRHCASCHECAEAVRIQREAAMMLRTACAPSLPSGLMDRLSGLPMSVLLPPPSSGLPMVLDSDGVPMFVAHSSRQSDHDEPDSASCPDSSSYFGHDTAVQEQPNPGHHSHVRRVALPLGLLASAAAVVTVGTLGSAGAHLGNQTGEGQTANVVGVIQPRNPVAPSNSSGSATARSRQRITNARFVPGTALSEPTVTGASTATAPAPMPAHAVPIR